MDRGRGCTRCITGGQKAWNVCNTAGGVGRGCLYNWMQKLGESWCVGDGVIVWRAAAKAAVGVVRRVDMIG